MYLIKQLSEKIYKYDQNKAIEDILNIYKIKKFTVINFLYFFNLLKILEKKHWYKEYYESLISSDFVLPDGIALNLFFKKNFKIKLYNLNWTDFIPYFTKYLKTKNIDFETYLYWAEQKIIENVNFKYKKNWNIIYFQNGYSKFVWDKIKNNTKKIKLFLVGLGTPKQEIWIKNNLEKIKNNWLIVFGVGWLFDFLWGKEKRAPYIIRKLNLERLRRGITNPKKNFKKVIWSLKVFKYLIK